MDDLVSKREEKHCRHLGILCFQFGTVAPRGGGGGGRGGGEEGVGGAVMAGSIHKVSHRMH